MISRDKIIDLKTLLAATTYLQAELLKETQSNYWDVFNPVSKSKLFGSNKKNIEENITPVAKKLLNLGFIRIRTLSQIISFVLQCEDCLEQHSKIASLQPFIKKFKPAITELRIAAQHISLDINARANSKIEVLSHGVSIFREMELAHFYDVIKIDESGRLESNIRVTNYQSKVTAFHIKKLEEIRQKLDEKDPLVKEIDDIIHKSTEPNKKQRKLNITHIEKLILNSEKERIESDLFNMLFKDSFLSLPLLRQLRYLVRREIMFNFVNELHMLEREFFWKWHVLAVNAGLNTEVTQNYGRASFRKGENIVAETRKYYLRGGSYGDGTNYLCIDDLLRNEELAKELETLTSTLETVESDFDSLKNNIKLICKKHLESLKELEWLGKSLNWQVLLKFPDTNWGNVLTNFVKDNLLRQLHALEAFEIGMSIQITTSSTEDKSAFSKLPQEIKAMIYKLLNTEALGRMCQTAKIFYHDKSLQTKLSGLAENDIPGLFSYTFTLLSNMQKFNAIKTIAYDKEYESSFVYKKV